VVKADVVGADHVRAICAGADGARLKAVAFRQAATPLGAGLLAAGGRRLWLAGRISRDDWGGTPKAELHIEDAAWAD
jgi:single-stranded-DNA-specific exonuclease